MSLIRALGAFLRPLRVPVPSPSSVTLTTVVIPSDTGHAITEVLSMRAHLRALAIMTLLLVTGSQPVTQTMAHAWAAASPLVTVSPLHATAGITCLQATACPIPSIISAFQKEVQRGPSAL
jgi:hypothetical protein